MSDLIDYCEGCKNAVYDFIESYDRHRKYFIDDCKKGLIPVYNKDEECVECEGKEYINAE